MRNFLIRLYLGYLIFFAKAQLKKINPIVIGVGGASGKSSTAYLIAKILEKNFKVREGRGKNSETGIPLSILGIDLKNYSKTEWLKILFIAPWKVMTNFEKYDIYVAEMGIDSPNLPKNMDYLLGIIKPNISLLTNIEIEHSQNFDSLVSEPDDKKRKEEILKILTLHEGKLLKSASEADRTVVNLDDPNISSLLPLRSKVTTVSAKNKKADFFITKINISENSFVVNFVFLNDKYVLNINQPLPEYFAYSLILATATSFLSGISVKVSIKTIENNFSLSPGRFTLFKGIKNSTVIDSSYNSSFGPLVGALETLSEISGGKRKVGILGDMRELGSLTKILHEGLVRPIVKNLNFAILIGPNMKEFVAPLLEAENFKFKAFNSFKEAKQAIEEMVREKDVILVKGSQNTLYLERAVEILIENKEDVNLLPRRGKFWDKMRKKSN